MNRREFISGLAGAAAAWPMAARAQQAAMPMIGLLSGGSPTARPQLTAAFRKGLSEAGYVEGQNVTFEYRGAGGKYDRLPELVADLLSHRVAVICAEGPNAATAAKAATSTVPIVFSSGGDVVKSGLVASLNWPGGNATGVNLFTQAVEQKKFELLGKLMPTVGTVAFLINPNNPAAEGKTKEMQEAARSLDRRLHVLNARTESEIEAAFGTLAQLGTGALVVGNDLFFDDTRREHRSLHWRRDYATSCDLWPAGVCSGRRPNELRNQPP